MTPESLEKIGPYVDAVETVCFHADMLYLLQKCEDYVIDFGKKDVVTRFMLAQADHEIAYCTISDRYKRAQEVHRATKDMLELALEVTSNQNSSQIDQKSIFQIKCNLDKLKAAEAGEIAEEAPTRKNGTSIIVTHVDDELQSPYLH